MSMTCSVSVIVRLAPIPWLEATLKRVQVTMDSKRKAQITKATRQESRSPAKHPSGRLTCDGDDT